jgi:hypothetical protein
VLVPIAMNKIPLTSQFNLFKGIWFVFRDGDREIAAHNSLFAKERVFINGEIVSENRSLNRIGKHQFIFNRSEYEVVFNVSKVIKGEMECSLFKNNLCIGKFKTYYSIRSSKASDLEHYLICFLIMIFVSSVAILFRISPFFSLVTGLGVYILIAGKLTKGGEFIIEEINL